MVKFFFEKEFTMRVINTIVNLAEKNRKQPFRVGEYTVIPKAVILDDHGIINAFSSALRNVKGVLVDVIGVHKKYLTQIEIYKDGSVVVSPSRPREAIEKFLKILIGV